MLSFSHWVRGSHYGLSLAVLVVAGCSEGEIVGPGPDGAFIEPRPDGLLITTPDVTFGWSSDAAAPVSCDGGYVQCVSELGSYCGTIGDGCGGALECGDCPGNQVCGLYTDHVCAPAPGTSQHAAG